MAQTVSYLVVDDDPDVLKAAVMALSEPALTVDAIGGPQELEAQAAAYDAILLDMNFAVGARDGAEGFDGLARLRAADPALSVVLMTTYGGVSLAVEGLKRGPWTSSSSPGATRRWPRPCGPRRP